MVFFTIDKAHIRKCWINITWVFYSRKPCTKHNGHISGKCEKEWVHMIRSWKCYNPYQIWRHWREVCGLHRCDELCETRWHWKRYRRGQRPTRFWSILMYSWTFCTFERTHWRMRRLSPLWKRGITGWATDWCTWRRTTESDIITITKNISHKNAKREKIEASEK